MLFFSRIFLLIVDKKKINNNGNLIPLEIGSFPFYPDCNIYSPSMFGVRLDIFSMYEYWKLFELRGKSISLTSMARTTHARKCLWIVQIITMRAINHSLSERLKCKHNNTCTHFSLNTIIFIVIDGIIILVLDRIYTWCGVDRVLCERMILWWCALWLEIGFCSHYLNRAAAICHYCTLCVRVCTAIGEE